MRDGERQVCGGVFCIERQRKNVSLNRRVQMLATIAIATAPISIDPRETELSDAPSLEMASSSGESTAMALCDLGQKRRLPIGAGLS